MASSQLEPFGRMAVLSHLPNHAFGLARAKDDDTLSRANPLAVGGLVLPPLRVVVGVSSGICILPSAAKSVGTARRRDRRAPIQRLPMETSFPPHRGRYSFCWHSHTCL